MIAMSPPRPRPVLRYPGGKARIANWIIEQMPPHDVYCEPFFGGGSVLFAKPRCAIEIVNDLDDRVVNLFRVLRDQPEALIRAVELTPWSRTEFELSHDETDDPVESARRFLVRSAMGHGVKIGNVSGWNNDSSQRLSAISWAAGFPDRLRNVAERLRGVVIEKRTALRILVDWAKPEALIYADPPYVASTIKHCGHRTGNGNYAAYYRHTMTDADHAELLDALNRHPGPVLLSGYRSELYDDRLTHWRRVDKQVLAYRAAKRTESLWINPIAVQRGRQMRMEI